MGRLFWKVLAGFWLALIVAAAAVGFVVSLEQQARFDEQLAQTEAQLAESPSARRRIVEAATLLRHAGPGVAAEVLVAGGQRSSRRAVLIVDEAGNDLLGRDVPAQALARARATAVDDRALAAPDDADEPGADSGRPIALRVQLGDARYIVFATSPPAASTPHAWRARSRFPRGSPGLLIIAGLIASLAFAAGLAWYMAQPIRLMRGAVRRMAAGDLATRISARMGRRRDELSELACEFDDMAARLQALIGSHQRLLHDVSHELRSPLARLQAAIGLAEQDPERTAAMLARIEHEAARLDALVGEVLALARAESTHATQAGAPVPVDELLAAVSDDASFEAEGLGCEVRFSAGAPDVVLNGHSELLHRAFDNVVRNALRHTALHSSVEIRSRLLAEQVEIRVDDHGPGIAATERERMFEPFSRGRASGEGFGLGLAIARRAIEAHGGHIEALDRPGGGLRMRIVLPLQTGVDARNAGAQPGNSG